MSILRNRFATVVTGAVVIAGLGATGAVAADAITGEDVVNSSITDVDIKDGTLRPFDFNSNVRQYFDTINERSNENNSRVGALEDDVTALQEAAPDFSGLEADGPYPGATNLTEGDNSAEKWVGDSGATLQRSWVMCAPGKVALGGGFSRADEGPAAFKGLQIVTSQPIQVVDGNPQAYSPIEGDVDGSFAPNGWLVEGFNNNASGELIVRPHVTCASVG